jgi:polyhydroxyalkanoate synthesis regulator phasin
MAAQRGKPSQRRESSDRAAESLEALREALTKSVTISRERLEEVVDDAVRRGRMTRGDAEDLVGRLVSRGREQTDELLGELERTLDQARGAVSARRERAVAAASRARGQVSDRGRRLRDEAAARNPISGYDGLSVREIRGRLAELTREQLDRVGAYERANRARKGVLDAVDRRRSR